MTLDDQKRKMSESQLEVAQKIAGYILTIQGRIALYLNQRTAHYTTRQKYLLLMFISFLFSGISLYLIIKSIN
ncbi:MAG: hypothetical protein JWQ25_1456 [Daejeonella sp.]|nr:hypothetical protein [Daejeonella sp.]